MSRNIHRFFALAAFPTMCALLPGCSSMPESTQTADKIAVYDALPSDHRPYRLVKRLWVPTWRSAFVVPTYRSVEEGESDLRNEAAALGGDAIMNFGCYPVVSAIPFGQTKLICNANVIKFL